MFSKYYKRSMLLMNKLHFQTKQFRFYNYTISSKWEYEAATLTYEPAI